MNQSTLVGGALLAAFALFITSRNRLSSYGRILWGDKPDAHSADAASGSGSSVTNQVAGAVMGQWAQDLGDQMDALGAQIDAWTGAN